MFTRLPLRTTARLIGAACCLAVLSSNGQAALNAYEPFNYASIANGTATTADGFSGNWVCAASPAVVANLTYPNLATANSSLSSTVGRLSTSFATPLASGTKYISFLFNQTGNNGGNHCGVYFPNGGTGLFFGYGLNPVSTTTGDLRPGSINTVGTATANATSLASGFTGTYSNAPYLIVVQIDFNTSGTNDTVTIYVNPNANSATPGVAAKYTLTTFNVGAITGIGFQRPGGAFNIIADEIRVGDTYGDVVGVGGVTAPVPPAITGIAPASGYTNGGTSVTITGSNFLSGATVKFGANTATGVIVNSSNSITATTPAGAAAGAVNVVVVNTNSTAGTNLNAFTYLLPPPAPPQPQTIVPGSIAMAGSNLTLVWQGKTNTTCYLLSSTEAGAGATWTTVATNIFGSDGRCTNSVPVNVGEAKRFYGLSVPSDIVVVQPPAALQSIPSGSTNAIGLAWAASVTPGVTGYQILYGTDSGAMTNSITVGNVTSANISGLVSGQTYYVTIITLTASGQSVAGDTITAQTDSEEGIIPLFNAATILEAPTSVETTNALVTYLADRARDRHAREDMFHIYDHYLSWYWEQRVANIEIVDRVAKGGSTITFNFITLDKLNPAEFRTFFRGLNTVAEYHNNQIAALISTNPSTVWPGETEYHYTASITANNQYGNRPIVIGDRVEVEISQFLNNPRHGRLNYYGTTFLYIVGQGVVPWYAGKEFGLTGNVGDINRSLDSYPLPTNAWMGGLTTLPYQYSNEPEHRFKGTAGNISPTNGIRFMLGRRFHHTDFGNGVHNEPDNPVYTEQIGKLGPKFINRSCVDCHVGNGRALAPAVGAPMLQSVVKVASDANGTPHPTLGRILQPQSTSGPVEGSATIASYTNIVGQYGDSIGYSLQKPIYAFQGTTPAFYSVRVAPQLVGMGLLEAIGEDTIMAMADPGDTNADGISGRVQTVTDPVTGVERLGRFTYKGGEARLSHQVAAALNHDMGITTTVYPKLDGETTAGPTEINDADLDLMTRYVALLGVAARRDLTNTQALQGEQLFASANCTKCHAPTLTTSPYHPMTELRNQTIHPYTDMLLHDMGPGLADNLGQDGATGAEWRTAPLWSIGLTAGVSGGEGYLHDGRARTLEEAILWHGGEAEASKKTFRNMSAAERAALVAFLKSL